MLSGFHPTGKPVGFRHKFITSEKLNTAREQGKIQIPKWEIAIRAILESQEEMLNELFEDASHGKF